MAESFVPDPSSSLEQWLDWQMRLHPQEIDLGLERVTLVAQKMGVTRPAERIIVFAGTNGKGSSQAMANSILRAAGYTTGRFSSPHLMRYNERILIEDQSVTDADLVEVFHAINQVRGEISLSFFEFSALAALCLIQRAKVDVALLEIGLGGRLDAVNLVDADLALVSAVDLDHQAWLGDTRELIGFEKAGVFRSNQLAVCSDPDAPKSLINHAQNLKTNLACLGRDFKYEISDAERWFLHLPEIDLMLSRPALTGDFQLQNAAGVVALLYLAGWVRDVQKINQGLRQVTLAGRMQWLNVGASRWLLDVAHNPQSLDVLVETLQRENWQFDAVIFAQMQDKDVIKGLNLLMRAPSLKTAQWLLPDVRFERALPPNRLESLFPEGVRVKTFDSVESAVCFARDSSECPCARVLVMGSFYLIGPVLAQVSEGYLHG